MGKKPVPVDLPEEELKKLAGKTVKKGEDEYVIVVQGVDSGLCGKYWGDLDNLPSRRRSRRYNIPTCGQGVEPNRCKCRDGSTFTPTSMTTPPCGGRPLNIDSCSCPNGNTITANNFIAAAVPLIQDILSG